MKYELTSYYVHPPGTQPPSAHTKSVIEISEVSRHNEKHAVTGLKLQLTGFNILHQVESTEVHWLFSDETGTEFVFKHFVETVPNAIFGYVTARLLL